MSGFTPETIRRERDAYYSPMDSPAGSLTSSPNGSLTSSLTSSPTGSPTGSQYHQNSDGSRKRREVMVVNPSKNGGKKYTRKLKMGSIKYKTSKTNKKRGGKKSKTGKKRSSRMHA
jgi:hypothetical protein